MSWRALSGRLARLRCSDERLRESFVLAAVKYFNDVMTMLLMTLTVNILSTVDDSSQEYMLECSRLDVYYLLFMVPCSTFILYCLGMCMFYFVSLLVVVLHVW